MRELLALLERWFTSVSGGGALYDGGNSAAVPAWNVEHRSDCTVYTGAFAIYGARGRLLRQVRGRVVEWPGLPAEVYLCNPPRELRRHSHGPCLQLVAPGSFWFRLHWEKPARDFDTSRTYIEQLLDEALRGNR